MLSLLRLDFTGIAFSTLFFCLSLTPSLMPRTLPMAGLIGGINAAIGVRGAWCWPAWWCGDWFCVTVRAGRRPPGCATRCRPSSSWSRSGSVF